MGLIVSELFCLIGGGPIGDGSSPVARRVGRGLIWGALLIAIAGPGQAAEPNPCGPSVLDRLERHRLVAGETAASLASRYNLLPSTLLALNPSLRGGQAPKPGTEILIPPINGIRVETQPGDTWQSIAQQYRVRPDSVFTVNGCQAQPARSVFVPGVLWSPIDPGTGAPPTAADPDNDLLRYPLSEPARTLTDFGWQVGPDGEAVFNSYITLDGRSSAVVLATGPGTVAFVGTSAGYPGQLVVVNHQGGRQTRYANLGATAVQRGQRITAGTTLGTLPSNPTPGRRGGLWFEIRYNASVGWIAQNPVPYLQRMQPTQSTPPADRPAQPTQRQPAQRQPAQRQPAQRQPRPPAPRPSNRSN